MKNLIVSGALLLFAFSICSFQSPNPTIQEIFQEALNIETLTTHLAKDMEGNLLPLTIATNGLLSESINLSLHGKMVSIVNTPTDKKITNSILDLKEIKMKGKKSFLAFQYGEKKIKIRLKKEAGDWTAKMITVKSKNGFESKMVSSSETHF